MGLAGWSINNNLQTRIGGFNWPALINKAKLKHLGLLKVYNTWDKTSWKTVTMVTNILNAKKKHYLKPVIIGSAKNLTGQ